MNAMIFDSQRALAFLIQQASYIEPQVYARKYPAINYAELVPVDTSAPEWTPSVTFFSTDMTGKADWFNGNANDIPRADTVRAKFESTVAMPAIGYGYTIEELGQAQLMGMNLTADKAAAARLASEQFINEVAFTGNTAKGWTGLLNNAAVPSALVPNDGTGSARTFASKTAEQVLRDVNAALASVNETTLGIEYADTLLLPLAIFNSLATRRIDPTSETTILQFLRENNVYTAITGQELTIRVNLSLATAGASGTARMVAYRRAPEVVKMHLPMPFRFLSPATTNNIQFIVPGIFRLGGTDVRLPSAVVYRDGI